MYCEEELSWGGKGASVGYMSKVKGGKNVKILKAPLLLGKSKGASVLLKFFFFLLLLLLNPCPSYEYVKRRMKVWCGMCGICGIWFVLANVLI